MGRAEQLAEARNKVIELDRERVRIEGEIKAWKMIRDGLQALEGKSPSPPASIGPTEAIRLILSAHTEGLTTRQIRDHLVEYGVSIGDGKNYMSNLHTLLKRQNDVEMEGRGGVKYYRLRRDAAQ